MALWGGRFQEPTNEDLRKLNDSLPYDRRMAKQDIQGSIAYAKALGLAELLSPDEVDHMVAGLSQVLTEFEDGSMQFSANDEDIHTAVERRLTELIGSVGGKLHTGRSRNDQVATDFRLWVMQGIEQMNHAIRQLQHALIEQSQKQLTTLIPGYTHLQLAQPITVAHWLMSFFWMLERDRDRLRDAHRRTSSLPLGSGALSGNVFNIDRQFLAGELGFASLCQNSLDAVSDRDFVAETLFGFSMVGVHLSRLAEDIILYSNPAFGFVRLNDRYSTGSSLMPQKRNADPMELARGKSGRLIGNLTGLLTTLKGLPSGYNKDLQEDKEAIFDSTDTLLQLLPVVTAIVQTLQLNQVAMQEALDETMLATEIADYLVHKGLPFREAHHASGQIVLYAETHQCNLSAIPLEVYQEVSALFESDVFDLFDYHLAVAKRTASGGTAPSAVQQQLEQALACLVGDW